MALEPVISTLGPAGPVAGTANISPGSATWVAANRIIYTPLRLSEPYLVRRLWLMNGTAVSGNIDIALMAADGTRLLAAGLTAQAGTTAIQTVAVTATWIGAGLYYLAVMLDNVTGTVWRTASILQPRLCGFTQEAVAAGNPIPAVATFATNTTLFVPVAGLSSRDLV